VPQQAIDLLHLTVSRVKVAILNAFVLFKQGVKHREDVTMRRSKV